MLVPVLLFIVGLLFLIKGGDWFVDGASALARRFHLPELLIGATVVSIGTVYVFAPMAIATCVNLGLDPTAAAAAIVVSGWCGHFLPIDGMPAMIMGAGDYKITEFWKFTIPQYFIRLLALTVGAVLIFPMK